MLTSEDKQEIQSMITKGFALYDLRKLESKLIKKQIEYIEDIKGMEIHLKSLGNHSASSIVKTDLAIRTAALKTVLLDMKKIQEAIFKIEEHVT